MLIQFCSPIFMHTCTLMQQIFGILLLSWKDAGDVEMSLSEHLA